MTMSEVGRPGQLVDPISGGDVAADGTLLSVAEIQQRFREERARRGLAAAPHISPAPLPDPATLPAEAHAPAASTATSPASETTPTVRTARPSTVVSVAKAAKPARDDLQHDTAPAPTPATVEPAEPATPPDRTTAATGDRGAAGSPPHIPAHWVRVLAGHSGAGASTTALAIADAAAAAGRRSQIIEAAPASRSGLVSAASRELDVDESGAWRRGTRPHPATSVAVTITRRTEDRQPIGWPAAAAADESLVAVDLGLVPTDSLAGAAGGSIVVACRASVPGVRLTEQLLDRLAGQTGDVAVVVAMFGGRRWPGEVTASCGPRLRALREAGRVVTVPLDGHLVVTGPTHVPLPKAVLSAGRELLGLLDAARPGGVGATPDPAQPAPRQKGTTR